MSRLSTNDFTASRLHLVIWDRVKATDHKTAMEGLFSIMSKPYANEVMPLIRPLGRPPQTYRDYEQNKDFQSTDLQMLNRTRMLDSVHTAHCEIWFQVSTNANKALSNDILHEFANVNSACFFWDHVNPLWAPLGEDLASCDYARSRNGSQNQLVSTLGESQVAFMLRVIWNRASDEIFLLQGGAAYAPINPLKQLPTVRNLMKDIFADIDLCALGITQTTHSIDPTDLAVSHMAAFAVNAVTQVMLINGHSMYGLEEYSGGDPRTTRPMNLPDRLSFFDLFR